MTRIRSRSATFAARLTGRLSRRATRRGINLPLVAVAPAPTHHVVHRHTRLGDVIQSRLSLVLHLHRAFVSGSAVWPRHPQMASPANHRVTMPMAADRPRRTSAIAERLALRVTRTEATPSPLRSSGPVSTHQRTDSAATPDLAPRVAAAMTLPRRHEHGSRRHEPALTGATRFEQDTHADDRGVRTPRPAATRREDAAPVLPDREIERLAGRVIDSIDRRIAAQRERLGRF